MATELDTRFWIPNEANIKDNYKAFRNAYNRIISKTPEIDIMEAQKLAAYETATGKWCKELGFKKVTVIDYGTEINAKFE